MVKIDPDWWKTLFDETYLITDARSVCDESLTCREVDFLQSALKLEDSWPILDLCGGQGRHALELSRRGFQDITVLDYSRFLIKVGKERARKEGLNVSFVQKDARETGLPDHRFKVIMVMASSFGYFVDENQNEKILREAFRLLRKKGDLLLDLPNRDYVLHHFKSQSWHEANEEILVCRSRNKEEDIIFSREMVVSKKEGLIRDSTYCTRLYSPDTITALLRSAGFRSIRIQREFASHDQEEERGLLSNRMIVIAQKP